MAGLQVISEARGRLEERLLELRELMLAFQSIRPDGSTDPGPSWLWISCKHVDALATEVEAYMAAVHVHAVPLLRDMQRLSGGG